MLDNFGSQCRPLLGLFIKLEDTAASKLSGAAVHTKHASQAFIQDFDSGGGKNIAGGSNV